MAGLFDGVPTKAPSSSTSTTETPKWFQDLVYQQMMAAKAVADTPYQPYTMPRIAQATPDQQAAYSAIRQGVGTWKPMVDTAITGTSNLTGVTNGFNQATGMITGATAKATSDIGDYMNPYVDAVTSRIAQLGARNLSENLLPAVSDNFIRAGQFGSSRMGEFGARALRDTQEAILAEQARSLESGYGQALGASQADKSRMLSAGQGLGSLAGSEAIRQQGALTALADLGQQRQGLITQDAAALQSIGQEQRAIAQDQLDAAYDDFVQQRDYPRTQLDWYQAQLKGSGQYVPTTTRTQGTSTQFGPSPLSQLASGYFALRGLTE